MKATDIIWDVDSGEDAVSLPNEIKIPEGMTDEDDISDYLSDTTGFCHKGYVLEREFSDIKENVKPFKVHISEVLNRTVIIFAESKDEAYDAAEEFCNAGIIDLVGSDFESRTVDVLSVCGKDEIKHYRNYKKEEK